MRFDRECDAYNCAEFAAECVEGFFYCPTHARNAREQDTGSNRFTEVRYGGGR